MLALPDLGLGRELRLEWERTAQFTVVPIEIEARGERGQQELRELAKPVNKSVLVAGLCSIKASDCLEILWGAPVTSSTSVVGAPSSKAPRL